MNYDPPRGIIASLASLALTLSACGDGGAGDAESDADATSDATDVGSTEAGDGDGDGDGDGVACEVEALAVTMRTNPDSTISPFADVEVTGALGGAALAVRVFQDDEMVGERPATVPTAGTAWLWGLYGQTEYEVEAFVPCGAGEVVSPRVAFTNGPTPGGITLPEVVVDDPDRAHRGMVFYAHATGSRLLYVGVDHTGAVVWYRDLASFTQTSFGGDLKVRADGRLLVTSRNRVHVIEPWGEELNAFDLDFHHDVMSLPNGNFVAINDRAQMIDVPSQGGLVSVVVDGVVEVDPNGNTVEQWWASDHLDTQRYPSILSTSSAMGNGLDWTHANGLDWDAARSQVLLSIRHQHWVIGIDWPSGTVAWTLGQEGDYALQTGDPAEWFYGPHAPELQANGNILLYDNGNERPSPDVYSRATEFRIDAASGTAEVVWQYRLDPMTPSFGDADRMPSGHVLACAGGVPFNGPDPARIVEIDGSDVVWELNTVRTYRATFIESF